MSVQRINTCHGTHYLLDYDKGLAMRVPGEGRNPMWGDNEWQRMTAVSVFDRETMQTVDGPLRVGLSMMVFGSEGSWRLSSNIESIQDEP